MLLPPLRPAALVRRAMIFGKVRRTLLRDERVAWMKDGRAFRIMPAEARAHAEQEGRDFCT